MVKIKHMKDLKIKNLAPGLLSFIHLHIKVISLIYFYMYPKNLMFGLQNFKTSPYRTATSVKLVQNISGYSN